MELGGEHAGGFGLSGDVQGLSANDARSRPPHGHCARGVVRCARDDDVAQKRGIRLDFVNGDPAVRVRMGKTPMPRAGVAGHALGFAC